jgi:hypothetical protein
MATIEDLKGALGSGPALPNRYKIIIPGTGGGGGIGGLGESGNILCQATNLPGRQLTTNPRTIGMVTQKMPYGFISDDISLQFILDGEYSVKTYFDQWQDLIIGKEKYEVAYKNTYTQDVTIQQLDKQSEEPIYGVKLLHAFPVTINPIELGDGLTNQLSILNVQLAYTDWQTI